MSSMPASSSIFCTAGAGRGVILSIMLQGKETCVSSRSHSVKVAGTKPFFSQASATSRMLPFSFSPLWLQLSMLTTASGAFPCVKR